MSVEARFNQDADAYELVGEVDGVEVVFASVEGGTVRQRQENQQAQSAQPQTEPATEAQPEGGLVSNAQAGQ